MLTVAKAVATDLHTFKRVIYELRRRIYLVMVFTILRYFLIRIFMLVIPAPRQYELCCSLGGCKCEGDGRLFKL